MVFLKRSALPCILISSLLWLSCSLASNSSEASITFELPEALVRELRGVKSDFAESAGPDKSLTDTKSSDEISEPQGSGYYLDISITGDYTSTKTLPAVSGAKAVFDAINPGARIQVSATIYEAIFLADGSKKRTELYRGDSVEITVNAGDNPVNLSLKKVNPDSGDTPPDQPDTPGEGDTPEQKDPVEAEYTVREWQQSVSGQGYVIVSEVKKQGLSGSKTEAVPSEYEGFENLEADAVEQQTIAEDGSTIVNIYHDRKTYTLTYNSGAHTSENIPAEKVYRHGEKVKVYFDTSDVSGYVIGGWYTDSECTQLFDSTVGLTAPLTLYAKWIEGGLSGIQVDFNLTMTDIQIGQSQPDADGKITFTAPSAATGESAYSYEWKLDGEVLTGENGNTLVLDTSTFVSGLPYDLIVYVTKGESIYSAFIQIKKD